MASFPYLPIMAVAASLVSTLVIQTGTFVYAGYMVEYLGVVDDKDKAGYYAGAVTSAYMVGRACSSHAWGLVADRCGRRFVLVFGIVSNMILSVVFGCSPTLTVAVTARFLLGLSNGVMVVGRTLVAEVCTTKEHETIAMGWLTSAWTVGSVLGPGIGGLLTDPAKHHPNTFSQHGLFGRFPYLLPNLVGPALFLLALPMVLAFIKDTEDTQPTGIGSPASTQWCPSWWYSGRSARDRKHDEDNDVVGKTHVSAMGTGAATPALADRARLPSFVQPGELEDHGVRKPSWMQPEMMPPTKKGPSQDGESFGDTEKDPKPESLLVQQHIRIILFTDALFAFTYSGFDDLLPLWALSTVASGGLDWSSPQIGKLFFTGGLVVLVFETFLGVPYLTPWLGGKKSQRLSSIFEVPAYLLYPLLSHMSGDGDLTFVLAAILLFTVYVCSNSYHLCLSLTINNAVGSDRRAELNGISVGIESIATSIAPIVCSALFAFSINSNHPYPFEFHFVFYLLAATRLAATLLGWNRITDNGNME